MARLIGRCRVAGRHRPGRGAPRRLGSFPFPKGRRGGWFDSTPGRVSIRCPVPLCDWSRPGVPLMVGGPRDDAAFEQAIDRQYWDERQVALAHVEACHGVPVLFDALAVTLEELGETHARLKLLERFAEQAVARAVDRT